MSEPVNEKDKAVTGARKAAGRHTAKPKGGGAKADVRPKSTKRRKRRLAYSPAASKGRRRVRSASKNLFMEKRDDMPRKKKGAKKRDTTGVFALLSLLFAVGIGAMALLGLRVRSQHEHFEEMRAVVDAQTFYEGTTIEGVDVSKMTLSEAMDYWRERVEDRLENRTVTLDSGVSLTAHDLGYTSDYETVLTNAWSAGRRGSLEERYRMATGRRVNPIAYAITRRDYSESLVEQFALTTAQQIDTPAQEAEIASFDPKTYQFEFTEAVAGRELDAEALERDIRQSIENGGGSVRLVINTLPPSATTEEVAAQYGMISSAETSASSSRSNRLNNIGLALSFINGTCLHPGETFSFNDTVGQRTADRGFKKATAYSGGEVTEQVGGGICQVSTTLFNAVAKADMEIVERHNHSLIVHYVDKGRDATVDWGHQDFKFKNTSEDDIYICCYLGDDKHVYFGVFGKYLPNGETITLEAVTTSTVKYSTTYKETSSLPEGESRVVKSGHNGYKAECYKLRWDANGNQISRELLCKSYYKEQNTVVEVGA